MAPNERTEADELVTCQILRETKAATASVSDLVGRAEALYRDGNETLRQEIREHLAPVLMRLSRTLSFAILTLDP